VESQLEIKRPVGKERHERFYFPDGNIILLVENTLFKVHRFFFVRDSEVFREIFTFPPPRGQAPKGSSDDTPIKLDGQDRQDFENFLSLLYPEDFAEEHDSSFWFSCLRFSLKWSFERQKNASLEKIKQTGRPAEAIAAGRLCGEGNGILAPYFAKMVFKAPTVEDLRVLGSDDLLLLCQLQSSYIDGLKESFGSTNSKRFSEGFVVNHAGKKGLL